MMNSMPARSHHVLAVWLLVLAGWHPLHAQTRPPYTDGQIATVRQELVDALKEFAKDIDESGRIYPQIDRSKAIPIGVSSKDLHTAMQLHKNALATADRASLDRINAQAAMMLGKPEPQPSLIICGLGYANQAEVVKNKPGDDGSAAEPVRVEVAPGGIYISVMMGVEPMKAAYDTKVVLYEDYYANDDLVALLDFKFNPADEAKTKALRDDLTKKFEAEMSLIKRKLTSVLK